MPWTYEQATGRLLDPQGERVATGYAGGNCGKNPEGKNNPDLQAMSCIGPLPVGRYTVGEPIDHAHLGPYALPLTPDEANEMFGRSAFYVHGDSRSTPGAASQGCIILPRAVRVQVWVSGDHALEVV